MTFPLRHAFPPCVPSTPLNPPDEIKKGNYIMMILNINTTSTTNQFKAFGETVKVPYRVTLRDYTLANETRKSNYGKGLYNENLYDLMGTVKNGKLMLSSRWQSEIGNPDGYDLKDTKAIQDAISSWETTARANGYREFLSGSSEIKRELLVDDPPTVDSPEEKASGDDTVKPLSWLSGAKAPKVATTFMGQTLIAGSTKPTEVVTFPDNPAYNISVTYDSETGQYTVKAPIKGVTKGKTFKNAQKAQRAIAKYETAIKKHLAKTKKPEQNANPYAAVWNNPDFSKGVNVFDPNFKIKGLEEYKIPATNSTEPLFQTE
jgi:hypothetical protein